MSIASTNTFKLFPRWSQTNLASKQKLSFTKTHHVDIGTFQQVIIMSLDPSSCKVKYMNWNYCSDPIKWVEFYQMIDCLHTATFQVHETPPVQETGREFSTRSGDIQAVVRFITITINSSPSWHILTKKKTSRAAKAADDVQVVEIWKAGGLHRAFNMKVNRKPHDFAPTNQILS